MMSTTGGGGLGLLLLRDNLMLLPSQPYSFFKISVKICECKSMYFKRNYLLLMTIMSIKILLLLKQSYNLV